MPVAFFSIQREMYPKDVIVCLNDSIEDVFSVCNRLRSDFRVPCFFWRIYPGELEDCKLKEMISTLDFDNCTKLYMIGGKLNTSTLSFLFDRMDSRMGFKTTSEIPWNFKHPRALDFYEIKYEDAKWLTVNDLKTIRNGSWVELIGRTNFDNHDMNQLIKYWMECEEKMFTQLRIKLKDGITINKSRILKGVVCLSAGGRYYYRSKKLIGTHLIGSVEFTDGLVTLISWPLKRHKLEYMVPILILLEQKSDLTLRYSELIKKERELHARLENEEQQNDLEQEILEIEAEKRNVETEFYETIEKLKQRRITNIDSHLVPN
ncbi:unnamed protein product [Caenorhabditis brenneri]